MQDEIVFLLVPHVVRGEELSPLNLKEIDTGTGTSVSLRRIASIRVPASAVEPAAKPASQAAAPGAAAAAGHTAGRSAGTGAAGRGK